MFLGLFKVALLSVATCFSGVNSSYNQGSYNATNEKQVNFHLDNKMESYANPINNYLYIDGSDITDGFFGDFVYSQGDEYVGLLSGQDSLFTLSLLLEGERPFNSSKKIVSVAIEDNVLTFQRKTYVVDDFDIDDYYIIDFANHRAYLERYSDHTVVQTNININQFVLTNDGSYYANIDSRLSFLDTLSAELNDYILQQCTIIVSAYDMNNRSYIELADYLYGLGESSSWGFTIKGYFTSADGSYTNQTTAESDGEVVAFTDEDSYLFSLVDDDLQKGYWYVNGMPLGYIYSNLVLKISSVDVYRHIYEYIGVSELIDFQYQFTFVSQPNFNAPYRFSVDSLFIEESSFGSVNPGAIVYKTYNVGMFVSNGESFDTIKVQYSNAYGFRYYDSSSNSYAICNSNNVGFFDSLFYYNSSTDNLRFVAGFNQTSYIDNDSNVQHAITKGSWWINQEYRHLKFYNELTSSQQDHLTQFNTMDGVNGFTTTDNIELPLNTTINLINMGFGGLVSLLGIAILPGITLGTIILIPFFITLLLFIAKLFKR